MAPSDGNDLAERNVTRIRRDQVQSLLEITHAIVAATALDELLQVLLVRLVDVFRVDRGLVMLHDHPGAEWRVRAACNLHGRKLEDAANVSRRVLEEVTNTKSPLLASDVREDGRVRDLSSVAGKGVRGLLCCPLLHAGEVLGAVYLDSRGGVGCLNETARSFLIALCNLAAIAIVNARERGRIVEDNHALEAELEKREARDLLVGGSAPMKALQRRIASVAPLPVTVLVLGESGTGKEIVARAIHRSSPRAARKFVAVNCGELPEGLAESELFGSRRGAFTGAQVDRKGLFEEADGGTLFLDEIANTSLPLQAKLLRALQEGEVKRVGDNEPRKVDVRLVCATHADLAGRVRQEKFREDLYYRIHVVSLLLPPLRERKEDLPMLVNHFLRKYGQLFGKVVKGLTDPAWEALRSYDWPGNVRELENVLQRGLALGTGPLIDRADLGLSSRPAPHAAAGGLRAQVTRFEQELIQRTLDAAGGNIARAAQALGMARQQLHRLVHRHGLATTLPPPAAE